MFAPAAPLTTSYLASAPVVASAPTVQYVQQAPIISSQIIASDDLSRSDVRATQVLDSLKNFHIGAANEIYVLFEHKTKELEKAQAHVDQLNRMHTEIQALIKEREAIIRQLNAEFQNSQTYSLATQLKQYQDESSRLRGALGEIDSARQQQQQLKSAAEAEAASRAANVRALENELNAQKQRLAAAEQKLDQYLRSRTDEFGMALRTFEQEKMGNVQLGMRLRDLDAEAGALNLHLQQAVNINALIAERDAEIVALNTRSADVQALIESERIKIAPKDAAIVTLRAELAEAGEAFNRIRQSNNVLLKRSVVLEEDVSSGEEAEYDRLTDKHINAIKGSLQSHVKELRRVLQGAPVPVTAANTRR